MDRYYVHIRYYTYILSTFRSCVLVSCASWEELVVLNYIFCINLLAAGEMLLYNATRMQNLKLRYRLYVWKRES